MKRIIYTLLIILVGVGGRAQNGSIVLPDGIFGGLNPEDNGVVGAIGGVVNISASGGATYTIPIQVAEGIGGIQPNLSLVYNSQSGNGLLGWGWNLSGLSAITRAGQCKFYDDTITAIDFHNDRFLLDGQRLMVVNGKPYGADGTEYKTEIDGMSKIVSYTCDTTNGPASFTVWLPNGNIAYYGSRRDSRIGLQKKNDVSLWLLDSVVDRNGNYMSYHYIRGYANYFIDYISYTGNHTNQNNVPPSYKVKFVYENGGRKDQEVCFIGNQVLWQSKLLKGIKLFHAPSTTLLHQYDFEYEALGLSSTQYSYMSNHPELGYFYNRLKSVTFSKDDFHYNPTHIEWGTNDYTEDIDDKKIEVDFPPSFNNDVGSFFGQYMKFPGDFNGDGLSDVLVHHLVNDNHVVYVCINEGNTKRQGNTIGKVWFKTLESPIILNDNIDWIYVADFNGDGLDDFLCSSRERRSGTSRDIIRLEAYIAQLNNGEISFINKTMPEEKYKIRSKYEESILVGDFLGEGRCQFLMHCFDPTKEDERSEKAFLFKLFDDEFVQYELSNLKADKFTAADFNGDGVTEIIYSSEDYPNCKMVKLVEDTFGGRTYYHYVLIQDFGTGLTYWHRIFIGDFNGDGKSDLLTYTSDGQGSNFNWNINLFKGDKLDYPSYNITSLMGIRDPGNHAYSMHLLGIGEYHFLELADMNGDGKTDIIVRLDNGKIRMLYAPIRRESVSNGYEAHFADIQDFEIHGDLLTDRTMCTGNFYGTEVMCMFNKSIMYARSPITNRYGLTSITDGMGNRTSFSFGYLTNNPLRNDNIYSLSAPGVNLGNNIYHIPLPLKAVKEISNDNPYNNTIPVVKKIFFYENAFAHRKGRGFLGFERSIVSNSVGDNTKSKSISENEIASMGDKCLSLPSSIVVYDSQGLLLSKTQFHYCKFFCMRDPNKKVFMAKPVKQITDDFEVLGNRDFLRRRITEKAYTYSLVFYGTSFYRDGVWEKSTQIGTHDQMVETVEACNYQSTSETTYQPDDNDNWILGRPKNMFSTTKCTLNNSIITSKTVYQYISNNPFLPYRIYTYPNSESTLGSYVTYQYDVFGHVIEKTTKSLVDGLQTTKSYKYSPDGRFLEIQTTIADGIEYTDTYEYNPYYGHLRISKDCNNFGTYKSNSDRMGITMSTCNLDPEGNSIGGSLSYHAIRWLEGSGYEEYGKLLTKPVYFKWQCQQGEAKSFIIYDAAGRELRSVSFGLTMNNAIYKDTRYDEQGRVCEISEPYFVAEGTHSAGLTAFKYDDYDRPLKTTLYDNSGHELVCTEQNYNGLETVTTIYRSSNNKEMVADRLNIMGWKDRHIDYLDPAHPNSSESQVVVDYGYNADGSLAWTMVNNEETTKVSMYYDALGNRTNLNDPDYGKVTSYYNAFGQLKWTMTPKGDITEYEYDGLGRITKRVENDRQNQTSTTTSWNYFEVTGRLGLLEKIDHNNGEQTVSYNYDRLNRIQSIKECLFGEEYATDYGYDEFSRLKKIGYPSHYVTQNEYSSETGILTAILGTDDKPLWKLNKLNAIAQIIEYQTGDGTVSTRNYDNMHRLETQLTLNNERKIQDFIYKYDDFSNLESRTENKYEVPVTEHFTYDRLNRLETITLNDVSSKMIYDPHGRILSKQSEGQTVFDNAKYETYDDNGILKPHAISGALTTGYPALNAIQEVSYTMFDKTKTMTLSGNNRYSFDYGYDHERKRLSYTKGGILQMQKIYVGNCEFYKMYGEFSNTYLEGPLGVFAVVNKSRESENIHYIYKDNLGSWTTITDRDGNIVNEQSFDAWGNRRNPYTWTGLWGGGIMFDRGFTGHEHIFTFDAPWKDVFINMNGRMYDPIMSSFLSVDNYVQNPENSQNFNRYAYCFNNPLKYTDPSGEMAFIDDMIIAAVFGAIINGWIQGASGNINGIGDCGRALLGGAVTGAMGCGLSVVGGAGMSFGANLALGTAEGGATAAVGELISGGDGEDILKAAAIGAAFGAVTTTLTSENLHNALNKKGFKTNAKVFEDYRAGKHTKEGGCWQQEAIDYFEFDGKYKPNKGKGGEYVESKDYFGSTSPSNGEISYGGSAFTSYDNLRGTYEKELFHKKRIRRGEGPETFDIDGLTKEGEIFYKKELGMFQYNPEEAKGFLHAAYNNGLYPNSISNYFEQANAYWINVYGEPIRMGHFYDFIFKIPRRW